MQGSGSRQDRKESRQKTAVSRHFVAENRKESATMLLIGHTKLV
jgi:hypothetical protein